MNIISLKPESQWGIAWVGQSLAIAAHVTDEALTGFLPSYNSVVKSIRSVYPWLPLPTFRFDVWLGGLITGILLLLLLSSYVFEGKKWLRPVSYVPAILMIGNGLLHIAASFYLRALASGVYTAPILLIRSHTDYPAFSVSSADW